MISTVGVLKKIIAQIPDDVPLRFSSYDGGHVFEIGDSYLEAVDDGTETMFVLYTKKGEAAFLFSDPSKDADTILSALNKYIDFLYYEKIPSLQESNFKPDIIRHYELQLRHAQRLKERVEAD